MRIGVPREIKVHEYRVGLVPAGVRELTVAGHEVIVESGAGGGIGVDDAYYEACGAKVVATAEQVFASADMIVKVKEPQPKECAMLRPGQVLFAYLHLAADREQAQALMKSGATAIAYETVTGRGGSLPLLTPMSEVAGRMSIQVGAGCLQKAQGGLGVLLGGVPGVPPAKVVILGGGVAARTRLKWPWACGPRSRWSIDPWTACAALQHIWRRAAPRMPPSRPSSVSCSMPISSLAPCWSWGCGARLVTRAMVKRRNLARCSSISPLTRAGVSRPAAHDACRADIRGGWRNPLLRKYAGRRAAHVHLRTHQRHAAAFARLPTWVGKKR
jgi:hypothetical protein